MRTWIEMVFNFERIKATEDTSQPAKSTHIKMSLYSHLQLFCSPADDALRGE